MRTGLALLGLLLATTRAVGAAEPDQFQPEISVADGAASVGSFTGIVGGADGLGLISYFDHTNEHLKVAHCSDVACSGATTSTVDTDRGVGALSSIVLGSDGLGLISYLDYENGDLKVAHCSNPECSK